MTAKPSAPRVSAHRARKAAAGLAEVRGIWAPPEYHAAIKEAVKELVRRRARLKLEKEDPKNESLEWMLYEPLTTQK